MHTMILVKFDAYSEYGRIDGGAWFIRRTVAYAIVCWC
jgi:hypothetical protein